MPTYSESDLVVPALSIIESFQNGIGTADLLKLLRRQLRPTGDDLTPLEGRQDDKFSQKVRNLKSHSTLERTGLATFEQDKYKITKEGNEFLVDGRAIERSLKAQGFTQSQRREALDSNYTGIVIEEGDQVTSTRSIRQRSAILRRAALHHFTDDDGSIECAGCGFRAEEVYGSDAKGLIEIHHTKPLFLSSGTRRQVLEAALESVAPLCPNCHRVVHRDPSKCMTITELKRSIEAVQSGAQN